MVSEPKTPVDPARDVSLEAYEHAIQIAFPQLAEIAPVRLLSEGWDCVAVETTGGLVFRFPKHEANAESQAKEGRLLPFLRAHVSPAIPIPEWQAGPQPDFPWGFSGYRKVPGIGLRLDAIDEENAERLAASIGGFLSELHGFSVERARAFDIPGLREWKAGYESLRDAVMPGLRGELTITERGRLRRWWRDFLAHDRAWDFEPALVHADLEPAHLLVDDEVCRLDGVIDWGEAAIGDPAIDFAGLMRGYGAEFTWRVVESYRSRGGAVDGDLFMRVRRLGAVAPFHAVRFALAAADASGPSLAEAVAELRAGPILSR